MALEVNVRCAPSIGIEVDTPTGSGDGGRKPTFIFVSNARGCFVIVKKLDDLCEGYVLGIRYESSRKFL